MEIIFLLISFTLSTLLILLIYKSAGYKISWRLIKSQPFELGLVSIIFFGFIFFAYLAAINNTIWKFEYLF